MKTLKVVFILAAVVWACANTDSANRDAEIATKLNDEKWSELAMLMRQMHTDAKTWRDSLLNGKMIDETAGIYEALISSTPTDSSVSGPVFNGFALNYQLQLDSLLHAQDANLSKVAYNNLVTACITCHQEYCPGPVKTIRKLYFSNEQLLTSFETQ